MPTWYVPNGPDATRALARGLLPPHRLSGRGSRPGAGRGSAACPAAAACTCPRASRASPSSRSSGCAARRAGASDYLAIARRYHTIILVGIPRLGPENRNEAARFVTLIDALYEHKVKLLAAADAEPRGPLRRRRRRLRVRTHRLAPDRDAQRRLSGRGARGAVSPSSWGRGVGERGCQRPLADAAVGAGPCTRPSFA